MLSSKGRKFVGKEMECGAGYKWTLGSLVCAYFDLGVAFFSLSASTMAFLTVNFLGFCGLSLFGISPDVIFKLHKFLMNFAGEKVSKLKLSALEVNDQLIEEREDVEREGEASSSSVSAVTRNLSKSDRVVVLTAVSKFGDEMGGGLRMNEYSKRNILSGTDSCSNGYGEGDSYKLDENPFPNDTDSSSEEVNGHVDQILVINDKSSVIRLLEEALEDEKITRSALYVDLEKERSAAASAAEEAMAMISRLQEEKAFIEMEARQYQRVIEEKTAYEEDEMAILKEILVRRETEKLFLEKEVEAYRQMVIYLEDKCFSGNYNEDPSKEIECLPKSISSDDEEEHPVYDVHVDGSNLCTKTDYEKLKHVDGDEWHEEMLETIKEGGEKLIRSMESSCPQEKAQFKLLDDIACQLEEIRHLTLNHEKKSAQARDE
ncbi:unnamed protein product [Cuscuta epithymum]|uniref:GTD-binding domain-containing protein n=1 Tax=Cuscuta epithymum TaxID=186058 RepID=A0AAV0F355_9ASTE|nr:unnamed protein product [Cuscuta epithymum]